MIKKYLIILIILNSLFGFSQVANDGLINSIKTAEKILITSHDDFNITVGKQGKNKILNRTLLKDGKPNNRIIKEQVRLEPKQKQELIEIISGQKNDSIWDGASCFWPHHTIFIYNEKRWSYIDLCFGCDHYSYSSDLQIDKDDFLVTYEDWRKLEAFFREQGLNYKMPERK